MEDLKFTITQQEIKNSLCSSADVCDHPICIHKQPHKCEAGCKKSCSYVQGKESICLTFYDNPSQFKALKSRVEQSASI